MVALKRAPSVSPVSARACLLNGFVVDDRGGQ